MQDGQEPDTGAIPVAHIATLRAGEQVVGLAWVEDNLAERCLVGSEKSGWVGGVPEVPHPKHPVVPTRHQNVRLRWMPR